MARFEHWFVMFWLGVGACQVDGLPPDVDTSTTDSSGAEAEDDMIVNDGLGEGIVMPPRIREDPDSNTLARFTLVIGAPGESWEGVVGSRQLSILLDSGSDAGTPSAVLDRPVNSPHTIPGTSLVGR